MKKTFSQVTLCIAAIAFIATGCSKDKTAPASNPATSDYAYDPSSIKSIMQAVDQQNGTNYSAIADNPLAKERVVIIPGIVDPYNPGITCYTYNWICEVIVYGNPINNGSAASKGTADFIGQKVDLIACTPSAPTLYKGVTILDHYETANGTETVFK